MTLVSVAAAALYAHTLFLQHAGALWRDEANTAAFAGLPSFGTIWSSLRYDSVPLVSTLLVRAWAGLGGGSDSGLRWLGWIVGCGVLAATGLSARLLRLPMPSCSLLLFALNVWVIRGGDAIRPWGLGMLLTILAFASLGWALQRPRPWSVVLAALCAVLSVHTLYVNAILVAAMCLAGVATGLSHRSRARAFVSLGVGLAAGLSLLPYVPALRGAGDWGALVRTGADVSRIWTALASTAEWDGWCWVLLAMAGIAVAVAQASRAAPEWERQNLLYAAITLAGGALAFLAFVVWSRLPTQPWYYLPLIALGSVSLDVLVGPLLRRPGARLASCAIILLVTVLHLPAAAPQLRVRQTNLDLVAADVGKNAGPGDLVIVTHWFFGITFHRYYSGHAPWMTIPPLEDTRIHRYDLLKRLMEHPEAVHSRVLEAISRTLMAGGRVFLVGGLPALSKGETPVPPPPAPTAGLGWDVHAYTDRWERLVVATCQEHVVEVKEVPVSSPGPVIDYEKAPLYELRGWQ